MDRTDSELLETIAGLHDIPEGSFNIRKNGKLLARNSTADIEIIPKKDKDGIDTSKRASSKNRCIYPYC